MFDIRDFEPGDISGLFPALRESDTEYLAAMGVESPDALDSAFSRADQAYSFWKGAEVVAVIGRVGQNIWVQTCSRTDGRQKDVIRSGRAALSMMPDMSLYCVVPASDRRVRLLCAAMGFTNQAAESPDHRGSGINHIALWRCNDEDCHSGEGA